MYQYLISQATFDREEHTRGGGLPDQVVCAFCFLPFESVELYNCQVFCLVFVNISFLHFNILLYLLNKNIFSPQRIIANKILPNRCWLKVLNKLSINLSPIQHRMVWQKSLTGMRMLFGRRGWSVLENARCWWWRWPWRWCSIWLGLWGCWWRRWSWWRWKT